MSNRLSEETSPYLLQHADNPVHWQPWDDQALAEARDSKKPILLSIGYSACHWCHVMAHESFEDPAIAAVMNEHFVSIKVDREERPDLDKVYQLSQQLLTNQTGGWPLTMFLDPETLLPFFGGTYFPRTPRYQLPGFSDLLMRISEVFVNQRDSLSEQMSRIAEVLEQLEASPETDEDRLDDVEVIATARTQLLKQYDPEEGGFGQAPKFPMPGTIERLLRHWAYAGPGEGRETLDMVMTTLTKIARGGIYDHLGGGFYRYATDRKWMIPHFEKMLYDNGQLLGLYADAMAVAPDDLFKGAVSETAQWLLREMRHPDGGFFAALDADSEGEEGKYYLWRRDQIKRLLDETEYLIIETLYGIDKPANFEGKWNLHRFDAWRSVVERLSMTKADADEALTSARSKLLSDRAQRVRPGLDDKILTAWNGLAIKGLTRAGMRLNRDDWIEAAQACVDFIRQELWTGDFLYATWKDGRSRHPGYLDDYANMLAALVELLSSRWREADAAFAVDLAEALMTRFYDDAVGGFYFTEHEHESLIYRPKPTTDDAQPPGNGTATLALIEMGHLFAETRYLDAAEKTLEWARPKVAQYPAGHASLISALELNLRGPEQIIIRGPVSVLGEWQALATTGYKPWRRCYAIAYEGNLTLPPYLPRLVSAEQQNRTVAYRCEGLSCSAPVEDLDSFRDTLLS